VKNKAIPITIVLAASFILSSQPAFGANREKSSHSNERKVKISREHKAHKTTKNTRALEGLNIHREHNTGLETNKRSRSIGEYNYNDYEYGQNDYADNYNHGLSGNYFYNYNEDIIDDLPLEYIGIDPISESVMRPNFVNSIEEVNNVRINGALPQITSMNVRAAERINTRIRESFLHLVNTGHRNIEADFEVHNWGGMTSLVVRYQMGERRVVNTFVFDHVSKNEVTLRNLLGRDFVSYINRRIVETKRDDSEGTYFITNFNSIRANQNFYVRDGKIYIIFEQAHIAAAERGVVEFVIPIETLNYTLSHNQFVEQNGKIFIPASVARRFGMDVNILPSGTMEIRGEHDTVRINVHNEFKNPNEVVYINGYDVALSQELLQRELGISVERVPNSREIMVSHTF